MTTGRPPPDHSKFNSSMLWIFEARKMACRPARQAAVGRRDKIDVCAYAWINWSIPPCRRERGS